MIDIIVGQKIIKDIELFVFDKDGTLIDLYNYWHYMVELRARGICDFYRLPYGKHKNNLMYEMGIDFEKRRLRPEGPVGLLPRKMVQRTAEDYLIKLNCKDVSRVCFEAFSQADELSLPLLHKMIKPTRGVIGLLRKIKENRGKIAVATSDITERTRLALNFLRIDNMVDFVIGSNRVENPKPHPQALEVIGRYFKIGPENSVMIGDAQSDIQMGINAGFKASIGVCTGLMAKDALLQFTPYVIDDASELRII